jgi:hypothetical protein
MRRSAIQNGQANLNAYVPIAPQFSCASGATSAASRRSRRRRRTQPQRELPTQKHGGGC